MPLPPIGVSLLPSFQLDLVSSYSCYRLCGIFFDPELHEGRDHVFLATAGFPVFSTEPGIE